MIDSEHESRVWKDEIVEEVRAARLQLFAACDFDLEKLAERLRRAQEASPRSVVTFPRRVPVKEIALE
jgi:hypothetical protein